MRNTIDITPSWEALLPALVEIAANGTSAEARKDAMAELLKLARWADQQNRINERKK